MQLMTDLRIMALPKKVKFLQFQDNHLKVNWYTWKNLNNHSTVLISTCETKNNHN